MFVFKAYRTLFMIVVLLTACVLEINDDDQYFTGQSGEACDVCVTGSLSPVHTGGDYSRRIRRL